MSRLTKLQTFYYLLITASSALKNVDNHDVSQMTSKDLDETQALRSIALIAYITYNSELLIEELIKENF